MLGKWSFCLQYQPGDDMQTRPLETEEQESAKYSKAASDTDPLCDVCWQHSHMKKQMPKYTHMHQSLH